MATDLPRVVQIFAERLHSILGDDLLAVYLGGSFSTGDFVRGASDYDLLVVIAQELIPAQSERIAALHEELGRTEPEGRLLEGDYVTAGVLVPEGTSRPAPWFRGGSLRKAEHMLSADNIANMRRDGVVVLGPPPASLLPDAGPELVRAAVTGMLAEAPDARTELAAARELLDVARSLSALETGEPTSRAAGLRWAMRSMDARWWPALLRAEEVRNGATVDPGVRHCGARSVSSGVRWASTLVEVPVVREEQTQEQAAAHDHQRDPTRQDRARILFREKRELPQKNRTNEISAHMKRAW